ncbi:MFS transporter PfmaC like protein [Verticillium longisporum]|nr:MFS transporter PfmaC like protein [Verticillium longisporum]
MFAENIGKEDQVDVQFEDKADAREEHFSARDIQGRFDLLRDLSDAEMEKLNKSVVKKIDWRMMPCVTIMFLMSYLERINVSNAMLAGLQEDLHMTDTRRWLRFCRFFIGLAEAPFFPGITLMTSSWYTKAENPMRRAIWHAGNTISNILSGFLAAGILTTTDDIGGLHAWQ